MRREVLEREIQELNETREEMDRRRGMNSGGVRLEILILFII